MDPEEGTPEPAQEPQTATPEPQPVAAPEPAAAPAEPTPAVAPAAPAAEPTKGPDAAQESARVAREREALKTQIADLQGQIDAFKADDGKAALQSQLDDTKKLYAVDMLLSSRGCHDVVIAHTAIDLSKVSVGDDGKLEGFDIDEFSKAKPFLFEPVVTVSTGAPAGGAPVPQVANNIKQGVALSLKKR